MKIFLLLFCLFISGCAKDRDEPSKSIYSYIDNKIAGDPIRIEIYKNEKPSINIESDSLYRYNEGNTILFGGVYADLFDDEGDQTSVMYSDSAIIFNKSDSVRAIGKVLVESLKGFKLYAHEIILYNDIKLVKSEGNIMFTSDGDTLYGKGFWSNFDMTKSQILKPIGEMKDFN